MVYHRSCDQCGYGSKGGIFYDGRCYNCECRRRGVTYFEDPPDSRREPDVFDSNKLNEEENLLQSYGEGDRFNNHKKKVNRDEQ